MENIELRDIPEWEGLYAATRDGRIWSHRQKKFMKTCGEIDNYQIVMLCKDGEGKLFYVHRLIALTYLPNPNNYPQVNHKDKHKDHNWVDNLEWCSVAYNLQYSGVGRKKIPVYCVELDKTYPSMYEAAIAHGGHPSNLTNCIHGCQHTFAGYHWRLA